MSFANTAMRSLGLLVALALVSCGGGESDTCVEDYGFQVNGDACDESGNSSEECPGVSCSCGSGSTTTVFICFDGTCVTAIDDCEAWCAATTDEQFACF